MNNDDYFKSLQMILPYGHPIHNCCSNIVNKLLLAPIDTCGGISIVCEHPMGNRIMLNVNRPGVSRQYYGSDVRYLSHDVIARVTCGHGSKRNSVGTDPNKFVTKPFYHSILYMASYLRTHLCKNIIEFNLSSLDLRHKFDSCIILTITLIPISKINQVWFSL